MLIFNQPVARKAGKKIHVEGERMQRDKFEDYLPEPMNSLVPDYIERGEGGLVYDKNGNRYIDFSGGWGCMAVGYSHPRVVEAFTPILAPSRTRVIPNWQPGFPNSHREKLPRRRLFSTAERKP